ncbi:hypothetical protein G5I_14289 [Acromyrmex echinatior]|uniref:Uncharacterized protein n=1 Tax=Acromyrmex echinatior TaxID=103372 RepID=F4X6Z9_ACREC|nr:hypothetical protein G5I_14289 [Acromyrmex echinatior]
MDKEGGGGARRFRRASEAWPGKAVRHSGSDGGGSEPITYYNCLASERSERGAPVRHPSSRRMASLPITSAVIANFSRPCLLLASRCRSLLPFTTPNPSFLPSSWSSPPPPSPPPPPPPLLVCINFLAEVTSSERTPAMRSQCGVKWRGISRQFVGASIVFVVCVFYKTNESYGDTVVMTATEKRCFVGANESKGLRISALLNTHNKAARGGVNNPATPDENRVIIVSAIVKAIYGFSGKRPKLGGYCTAMQGKRCG